MHGSRANHEVMWWDDAPRASQTGPHPGVDGSNARVKIQNRKLFEDPGNEILALQPSCQGLSEVNTDKQLCDHDGRYG